MALGVAKPSDFLISHHNDICSTLSVSKTTLVSLTGKLFQLRIVDRSTKTAVVSKGGYKGADILLDFVEMKLDNNPEILESVLEAMQENESLKEIVWQIKTKRQLLSTDYPRFVVEQQRDEQEHGTIKTNEFGSSDRTELDQLDPVVEARNLKQEFEKLLVDILNIIQEVDLDDLKLRIAWFFNAENVITPEIQQIVLELQSLTTPQNVLSFLVIKKFIGYLNYELIKAFQKAAKSNEMKIKIEEYEKKHDVFLHQFSYSALIDAFQKNPKLAPVSVVGLPEFIVKLNTPWEGKAVYTWREIWEKFITWPLYLMIVSIQRNSGDEMVGHYPQKVVHGVMDVSELLSSEEQLKIYFEKAIVAIKSGEDAHKFVSSATHIADRVEELVVAESNKLERNLTIAKCTLHKHNSRVKSSFHSVISKPKYETELAQFSQTADEVVKDVHEIITILNSHFYPPLPHPQEPTLTHPPVQFEINKIEEAPLQISMDSGYDPGIFINTPPDDLICSVCHLVLRDPCLQSCCGAHVCQICWLCETMKYRLESAVRGYDVYQIIWDTVVGETLPCVTESSNSTVCITRWKTYNKGCPRCRSDEFTTVIDKSIRSRVIELTVRCENRDCNWKGELLDLQRHVTEKCLYTSKICQYGCGKYCCHIDLPVHEQDECPNRPREVIIESGQRIKTKLTELEVKYQKQEALSIEYKNELDEQKKIREEEAETYKMERKKMISQMEQEQSLLPERSLLHPIENKLQEREAQLQAALQRIKELIDENETKRKTACIKDIELERFEATVKSNQEKLQNLTEKLSLLTEDVEKNDEICQPSLSENSPTISVNDVAVQFDYWVPMEDLLHGAHVVDEIVFNVQGDAEQFFNWNECGFRLYVPEEALLPTETCAVAVKALIAGRFRLPKRTKLYITKSFSHLEKAEAFKFRFNDDNETSPDSSIVLNFPMEEIVINGWYVQPYSWPCEVSKEDIDLLGTQELQLQESTDSSDVHIYPDIPMCMVSLNADDANSGQLRYATTVEGIVEKKTIFITRRKPTSDSQTDQQTVPHGMKTDDVLAKCTLKPGIHESKLQGKNLPEVITATNEVVDWFTLGLYLRLAFEELETIEKNYPGDMRRCRQKMLNSWISSGNATWSVLGKVLRKMNEGAVAEKIEEMYLAK